MCVLLFGFSSSSSSFKSIIAVVIFVCASIVYILTPNKHSGMALNDDLFLFIQIVCKICFQPSLLHSFSSKK